MVSNFGIDWEPPITAGMFHEYSSSIRIISSSILSQSIEGNIMGIPKIVSLTNGMNSTTIYHEKEENKISRLFRYPKRHPKRYPIKISIVQVYIYIYPYHIHTI